MIKYILHISIILLYFLPGSIEAQCFEDRHNTTWFDGWISCAEKVSPNPARPSGHWIMYDFDQVYTLFEMRVWNMNAPDHLDYGLQDVVIDLSDDGETWTEFGEHSFPQAPGSSRYEGDVPVDFDSANARFVLISALSNHGGSCYGLSEVRIRARDLCPDDQILWIAGNGNWDVPANWCNNRIPTEDDKVVIPSGVVVTIPWLYTAHVWSIKLDPTSELNMIGSLIAHKQE